MDLKKILDKLIQTIKKYKYAILIAVLGIILINIPLEKETNPQATEAESVTDTMSQTEEALAKILSNVKGAGKVRVMLTVAEGEKTLYKENTTINSGNDSISEKTDTVTVDKKGLVVQVIPPVYLGAVIVCQGADDPNVKWQIVAAASRVTGLGADKIAVLKMN